MKKTFILAGALLAGFTALAGAHDYKLGDLEVGQPWARATPDAATTGGAYLTISNGGESADRLVGGHTDVAERVEIHEMSMENDVMRMRQLPDGLEIPAGGEIALEPGGYHIMLMGLTEPLEKGGSVPLTLEFAGAGEIEVELAVEGIGAEAPGHGGDHSESRHHDGH